MFLALLSRLPLTVTISEYLYGTIMGATRIVTRMIKSTIMEPTASGFLNSLRMPSRKKVVLSRMTSCWAFSSSVAGSNMAASSCRLKGRFFGGILGSNSVIALSLL